MFARVELWIVGHALEELVENAPDLGAWGDAKLFHHVVSVDREIFQREGRRRTDLLLYPLPKSLERVHARRSRPTSDVVGLAEREQRRDVLEADLAYESSDRRRRPLALVPEHVIADEVRDSRHGVLVETPPAQDVPRGRLAKPTARSVRRASSAKRSRGSPTARTMRASRSRCPPNGSTSSPGLPSTPGRQAIAFIVKSRRERSSWSESVNATEVGCR